MLKDNKYLYKHFAQLKYSHLFLLRSHQDTYGRIEFLNTIYIKFYRYWFLKAEGAVDQL